MERENSNPFKKQFLKYIFQNHIYRKISLWLNRRQLDSLG